MTWPLVFQLVVNGLLQATTLLLIALGVSVLYSTQRFFNFVHGAIFALAAYVAFAAAVCLGNSFWASAILGVVAAALAGAVCERLVFFPLRTGGASPAMQMLASLGLYVVIINLISLSFGDDIRSLWSRPIQEGYSVWKARVSPAQLVIAAGSVVFTGVTVALLQKTRLGRTLRAAAGNPALARCAGLNERRVIMTGTVLGSALAGAAGVLMALDMGLTPTMGFRALLLGIVVCIVGGMGSLLGIAVASLFLGLAMNLGVLYVASYWQDAIAFGIMGLALLVRPQGIFGGNYGRADR